MFDLISFSVTIPYPTIDFLLLYIIIGLLFAAFVPAYEAASGLNYGSISIIHIVIDIFVVSLLFPFFMYILARDGF